MTIHSLLAAALCLSVLAATAQPSDTARVTVPTVQVGLAAGGSSSGFDAVLQPVRQATVTAQTGAAVMALRVKAGDSVRRGQALVRLDDREVRANTARGDAAVLQAQAELRNAQQVHARNQELRKDGFVSQAAVDASDNQFKAAQAAVGQAQAARTQAVVAQGFAEVLAPFDGVVLSTQVEAGDLALPGRPLLTVYEPGRLRAVVQVPASRVAELGEGATVQVELPDGRSITPASREMLPTADPVSQTVEWRLNLPPAATQGARPGQTVRVQVQAQSPGATTASRRLAVPAQSVLRRGEITAVYVALPQGFALRAVRLGPVQGETVEVLAGVVAGERIALDPVRAGLQGAVAEAP